MSRFENGWIKLHRSLQDSDIVQNPYLSWLWINLLIHANYSESKILWEGKQIVLPPGSVVFGMKEYAAKIDCSRATIHKWAHYLHDTGRILLEVRTKGCIATICNWDKYQAIEHTERTPSEREVNAERTPSEREVALIEESKNTRKKELNTIAQTDSDAHASSQKQASATHCQNLIDLWNSLSDLKLSRVREVSKNSKRGRALSARWKEKPNIQFWTQVILELNKSNFLLGENDRGWKASFDFILQPDKANEILEGKFSSPTNWHGLKSPPTASRADSIFFNGHMFNEPGMEFIKNETDR